MGTNNLTDKISGQLIDESWPNDIHSALKEDFVGRNSSGVPTSGKSLGTATYPWGPIYAASLSINGEEIDFGAITSEGYRVVSGIQRSGSQMPQFIIPAGVGNGLSFTIDTTPTALALLINAMSVTISSDIVETGLTAAPGSNNTALVNEADAADQHDTRFWGGDNGLDSRRQGIAIDSIGSEISALDGTWQAFQINNGVTTEIFLGLINGSNIIAIKRGFFFDESGDPIKPIVFTNNDTITLLKLGYVFVDSDGLTVDVSYKQPVYSDTEPASPASGDYWFYVTGKTWRRYNGSAFVDVERMLVGYIVNDDADCIAYRCVEFYQSFSTVNTLIPRILGDEQVASLDINGIVSVNGKLFRGSRIWDITADLAASADMYDATIQDRNYFFYLDETGEPVISDIGPFYRPELGGFYHPYHLWRAVFYALVTSGDLVTTIQGTYPGPLPPRTISEIHLGEGVRPGRLISRTYYTSSDTYLKTVNNPRFIRVRMWGGGGGGGYAEGTGGGSHSVAGGGGGGGYAEKTWQNSELDNSESVTVGAAGAAGNGGSGGAGGNSSFNGITAGGGGGGTAGGAASAANWRTINGGNGGTITGSPDVGASGQNGAIGVGISHSTSTAGAIGQVGKGGDSPQGGPGGNVAIFPIVTATSNAVLAGRFPGGGGAGAANANSSTPTQCGGGSGAAGLVIIEEYA